MNLDFLISIFFPPQCVRCSRRLRGGVLCETCRAGVPLARSLFCGACRRPIPREEILPGPASKSACHPDFPYLLGAASRYHDPVMTALVRALKFHRVKSAAEPLSSYIIQYLADIQADLRADIVVPIPLSKKRERERGFNQAGLIAKRIAERLSLPVENGALARTKHTPPQSEAKSLSERARHMRGCFSAGEPALVAGKRILLVDDVVTSGATFHEAARALRDAGSASVIALAAAQG